MIKVSKKYNIVGIFAHPDDETFGPGATLAKYAKLGHNVSVITATRGQAGQTSSKYITQDVGSEREQEAIKATAVLGINKPIFLEFFDGTLNQHQMPLLKNEIVRKLKKLSPDIIIIFDLSGISMHLDHIAVSRSVLELANEKRIAPKKVYFYGMSEAMAKDLNRPSMMDFSRSAVIDIKEFLPQKIKAMKEHQTQEKDFIRLISRIEKTNITQEHFSLAFSNVKNLKFPEDSLLNGLD